MSGAGGDVAADDGFAAIVAGFHPATAEHLNEDAVADFLTQIVAAPTAPGAGDGFREHVIRATLLAYDYDDAVRFLQWAAAMFAQWLAVAPEAEYAEQSRRFWWLLAIGRHQLRQRLDEQ